jgi:hypothetical protein
MDSNDRFNSATFFHRSKDWTEASTGLCHGHFLFLYGCDLSYIVVHRYHDEM